MDSPEKAPDLIDIKGFGFVDFHVLPHYTNQPFMKIAHKVFEDYSSELILKPISNNEVILIDGKETVTKAN